MNDDWGEGTVPARAPEQSASDDDRQRVVTRLRDAAGDGVLGLDELEDRLGRALAARTRPELDELTGDLPSGTVGDVRRDIPALRDRAFKCHLTMYALVIGMLIGIWALSGFGHPWPFYPAAGWGIGLAAHYMGATEVQRRRERRQTRELGQRREAPEHRRVAPPRMATPAERSRRYVAAMFVDVVGSTGLNEALGDDGWVLVRDRLRTMMQECFEREGGWEVNSAGDGILARFDHPNSAVCAAVEIQRRLAHQRHESGFAPSVRIGIHSGDVVEDGADLIGSVINLASRVTGAAEADQIMITEHVADHLDASFDTEDRGIHSLKGVTRPRHLLAIRWR